MNIEVHFNGKKRREVVDDGLRQEEKIQNEGKVTKRSQFVDNGRECFDYINEKVFFDYNFFFFGLIV